MMHKSSLYLSCKKIAKYFRGEEVPAVLPVPVGIVDKNSLQEAK